MSQLMRVSERVLLSRERLRQEMQRPGAGSAWTLAGMGARALLRPAATANPLVLVGGAVLVGALVAWSRPWRLMSKPVVLATLAPLLAQALAARPARQAGAEASKNA